MVEDSRELVEWCFCGVRVCVCVGVLAASRQVFECRCKSRVVVSWSRCK